MLVSFDFNADHQPGERDEIPVLLPVVNVGMQALEPRIMAQDPDRRFAKILPLIGIEEICRRCGHIEEAPGAFGEEGQALGLSLAK